MEYKFSLNKEEIDVLAAALGEIPLKVGMPVFEKLRGQMSNQTEQIVHESKTEPELLVEG